MVRCRRKSSILFSVLLGWVAVVGSWEPEVARADSKKVAVPKVKGPSKAGYTRFETGLKESLRAADLTVLAPKALAKAAKKAKKAPTTVAAARAAGAHYLVLVTVRRANNENVADGRIFDATKGEQVAGATESWSGKETAEATGAKLGRTLVERAGIGQAEAPAAVAAGAGESEEEEDAEEVAPSSGAGERPSPRVVTVAEAEPSGSSTTSADDATSSGGEATRAETSIPPTQVEEAEVSGEDALFAFSLGGGSRLLNQYVVSVGGQATGVNYDSSLLPLAAAGVRLGRPNHGLGADASFEFVPSKYQLAIRPAVTPESVNGRLFGVEGAAWYAFRLVRFGESNRGSFALAPLAGAAYDRFTVGRQTSVEDNQPVTLLVNSVNLSLQAGLRLGLRLGERFTVEADGRYLRILKSDEAPAETGDPSGGNGFSAGLAARFWFTDALGLGIQGRFRRTVLNTKGQGNRTTFTGDPELVDADIASTDAKASLAFLVAF